MITAGQQAPLDLVGDRGLARAGQAGEPQAARRLALDQGARLAVHVQVLPVDVLRAAQGEVEEARAHRGMALAIDQDAAAEFAAARIGLEGDGLVQAQVAYPDLVQRQALGGQVLLRVHVHAVLDLGDRGHDRARAELEPVGTPRQQRLLAQPQQVAGELVGHLRWRGGRSQHVAAADVDLVGEGERHRLAGDRAVHIAVGSEHARHARAPRRRQHHHLLAHAHAALGQGASEAAEVLVRTVHPLHRQAERSLAHAVGNGHGFQVFKQGRAVVPGRALAARGEVVAAQGRQRDGRHLGNAQQRGQVAVGRHDLGEARLAVVHQVHLVHRQHDVADAQQGDDVAVPARLREQALARIHQHHGQLRRARAGGHVARVLLMARAVGHDELAPVGAEEAVGHVDGDALLALGGEAVHQQGEIQRAVLRAEAPAVGVERGQLVLGDELGVVQQAPDQGALAVVHAAAGDEAQQVLAVVAREIGGDVGGRLRRRPVGCRVTGHQKYPSCFFFSIEAAGSWSITRPWRSEVRAATISAITASSVSACDSMAPVSG